MISACGLLDLSGQSGEAARGLVERIYGEKYRAGNQGRPSWRRGLRFAFDPEQKADIPVRFIGVWDTVGSLGVPITSAS